MEVTPFWESSQIPVCFVEPLSIPEGEEDYYEQAKIFIREAFEEQINSRSSYTTYGFGNCEYNYHIQGPSRELSPGVRIELTRDRRVGSSGSLDAHHGLSFTDAQTVAANIQVDYMFREGREGALNAELPQVVQRVALHEFLHLMGMQHENFVFEEKSYSRIINDSNWAIVPPSDQASIMYSTTRDINRSSDLTDQDVQCLELIHSRQILDFLSVVNN